MTAHNMWVDEAWERIARKVDRTSKTIGTGFPHASKEGKYDSMAPEWWTSGFWPGILWLLYQENGDERLKEIAVSCEEKMEPVLHEFYRLDHDAGFLRSLTSVAQYKLLGNEESKRRALTAASHLASRFNLRGSFIRAWNDKKEKETKRAGWSIIDTMMNLPLLYWASETINDPRFRFIAMAHADMVLREFIRLDGSVHHVVCFDPETGERVEARGGQGYSPDSSWSRGTAWALHGMALSYRYTKEKRYLEAAKRVAHFFIAGLPDDQVPYWDFRAPLTENMGIDTSAAACAASGLLEIARLTDPLESHLYEEAGTRIVKSLYSKYGAWDQEEEGLITMGTANFNSGRYVHLPLIYGDYFFVEAVSKLKGRAELFW